MSQTQAQLVVSQPQPAPSFSQPQFLRKKTQVSQVVIKQPHVSMAKPQPQVSAPLSGTT